MAALRSRRLEALFGAPLDRLAFEHIEGLVKSSAQEAFDLEYKQAMYGRSESDKKALAGDVAALANTAGGVIVIGIQEDEQARATALPGVDISDGEIRRIRQTVASGVSPMPVFDVFAVPMAGEDQPATETGDNGEQQPAKGFLVLAVPRSPSAPHAVLVNNESLRYPKRNGATIRYLSEPEVATAYRERLAGAKRQTERIEEIEREAMERLSTSDTSWLVISLTPDLPGDMVINQDSYDLARQQLVGQSTTLVPRGMRIERLSVGRRRLLAQTWREAREQAGLDRFSLELHADGSGVYALRMFDLNSQRRSELLARHEGPLPQRQLDDEWLALGLLSGLRYLAWHARDRAAAGGTAIIRAHLFPVSPEHPTTLGYTRGFPEPWSNYLATQPRAAEAAAPLDNLADPGPQLVAAAALLLHEVGQAFGVPELGQLTRDGKIRLPYWERRLQTHLRSWAEAVGIEVTEETLER